MANIMTIMVYLLTMYLRQMKRYLLFYNICYIILMFN